MFGLLRARNASILAIAASLQFFPAETVAQRKPVHPSVDLQVPVEPSAVRIGGAMHLVYELHITNLQPDDVVLKRVEVTDDTGTHQLAVAEGDRLAGMVVRPGIRVDEGSRLVVETGSRSVIHYWLTIENDRPVPVRLRHNLSVGFVRHGGVEMHTVEDFAVTVRADTVPVLNPPLRGGPWVAVYDPRLERGHRATYYTIEGRARIPGRYAIDWFRVGDDGSLAQGDPDHYPNWRGYGAEVFAVADGVVVEALDDLPEDLSADQRRRPLPLEEHSGNHVILDIGDRRYAIYEHLRPGSVRVADGDTVRRGQAIGEVGNSGSTFGPHLHFHVADAAAILAAEGIPYLFNEYTVLGGYGSVNEFIDGSVWIPASAPGVRRDELPTANSIIMFGPDR